MTTCPNCGVSVEDLASREECPECGTGREALFALAAGRTPRSERDTGIRRDALRPTRVGEQDADDE